MKLEFVRTCCVTAAAALIVAAAAHAAPSRARPTTSSARSHAAYAARAEVFEARIAAALDSGLVAPALAWSDSAIALRHSRKLAPLAVASYVDSLGIRFFGLGTPDGWVAAETLFTRSVTLKERALGPDDPAIALTLGALAMLGDYQGHYEAAARHAARALAIRRAKLEPTHNQIASSMRQLGRLRLELGQYVEADSLIAGALRIYEALGEEHATQIADCYNDLGEIRRVQDAYPDAERNFRSGLDVARARLPDDAQVRISLLNNLAGLYRDLARFSDAEPLLEEARATIERSPDSSPDASAIAYLNLAEIYRLQGRNDEAAPLYTIALEKARPAFGDDHPDLTLFVNQTAVSLEELGRLQEAEPLFREALAKSERALGPDHPLVAQSLHDLGRLLERRGAHAAAESTYRHARDIRIARLGERHPEVAASRVHLARSMSMLPSRGDAAALRELEPAIRVLDASRANPDWRIDAYALRSAIRARSGRSRDAIADLAVALTGLDSLRAHRGGGDATRAAYVARHLDLYHRMVALRLAAGDRDGALEAHERGRARVIRDQLAASGVDLRASLSASDRAALERTEAAAREALARAQRAIEQVRLRGDLTETQRREQVAVAEAARDSAAWALQRVTESIKDRSPLWRTVLTTNGRPATRAEIQRSLARDEIVLEYHVGGDAAWVFAIVPDGKAAHAWPLAVDAAAASELGIPEGPLSAAALERAIAGDSASARRAPAGLADLLSGARTTGAVAEIPDPSAPGTVERRLHSLWRTLVPEGARALVHRASSVIVVPDGALHLIPFDALVVIPRSPKHPTRYWLDDGPAVRYTASSTALLGLAARHDSRPLGVARVLSVSDPSFAQTGDRPWAALPGTRRETEAIRAGYAPGPVDALTGAEATEPAVRRALAGHSIIHLATHGFVTERRSNLLAGLVLAPTPGESNGMDHDGLLQLFEIYELPLDCEVAILSACETAKGTRVAGEGVFALSRGFHAAGAARVIASLWPVNDASTAELMGAMFRAVAAAGTSDRAIDWPRVLHDAKRAVRAQDATSEPFYWAPFILSGLR